jgi:alginate O-acetyltransferase complex protein AlgI
MVFHTIDYLLFLPAVLAAYLLLPWRGQNALLILAGYIFYGWIHPWYCLLLASTTLIDFACARWIAASSSPRRRKQFLALSVVTNFTSLAYFKYAGLITGNVTAALAAIGIVPAPWVLEVALPAGISFFTFQNVAYVTDVYRGHVPARRSLLDYGCFASFFPQLVAGPIERADNLLRQVCAPRHPTPIRARSGLVLILWGLFEKVVIADSAALLADKVFSLSNPSFPILWGGVLAFGVQIYADFSAYTDIARGSARLLGFELRENFNHPYLAQSPPDFWRRWHMSLSTWFRDYVYIPLGGSRHGPEKTIRNLIITFFLSGLWHGASWNFVLWGLFHGVLVAFWPHLALTFGLMNFGWLLFREHSFEMIWRGLKLNPLAASAADWRMGTGLAVEAFLYGIPLTVLYPIAQRLRLIPAADDARLFTWRWTIIQGATAGLCLVGVVALRCSVGSDFIYFQF